MQLVMREAESHGIVVGKDAVAPGGVRVQLRIIVSVHARQCAVMV